mmetsp:Transcript_15228/g.42109  ORF Transcript_15228/g.42109 Transcript_15228/m.42109 type:complete len:285 (-) Transcript_15228:443-1297(-)
MPPRQRYPVRQSSSSSDVVVEDHNSVIPPATHDLQRANHADDDKYNKPAPKPVAGVYTEADRARDRHDYFNLLALPLVIGTILINYDYSHVLRLESLQINWVGEYFWLNWFTTKAYFFADLTWVSLTPICVKSPNVIIKHHMAAILYLMAPLFFPEFNWFIGAILSVEINTWFLILRRVVYKQGVNDKTKQAHPVIVEIVSFMFYTTWILIRCIVYPAVLVCYLQMAKERIDLTGSWIHVPFIFIPVHLILCCLNLKWTYDLFKPLVRRWIGSGQKSVGVQNGL